MTNLISTVVTRLILVVFITAIWVGLWGDISIANVAGGLLLAVGIIALKLGTPRSNGIRIVPLLRLTWLVLVDLAVSTVTVAYETMRPSDHTNESVIEVEVPPGSQSHFLLLTILITVTPGTAVVDADADKGTLYLHLLHHHKADATVKQVLEMADLSSRGLPNLAPEPDNHTMTGASS